MDGSGDKGAVSEYGGEPDRRTHLDLRGIFDRAYEIAYPLLDPQQNLSSSGSSHFLRVVLHDAFPDLHKQDIAILAVSVERVFRQRNTL